MSGVRPSVLSWWDQPDQFDAMSALLSQSGLLRSTRLLLAGIAIASGIPPMIMFITSTRSTGLAAMASMLAGGYVALSTSFFVHRWPTRTQSAAFAAGGAAVISAWSLAQSDSTLKFLACAVMIIPGAYLAIFHSTKLMLPSFALSAVIAVAAAIHTGRHTNGATAFASFCVLWLINVAIPLGARGLSRAMTRFALDAHHDPLTDLLNRRGLTRRLSPTSLSSSAFTHMAVLLVDIDGFKTFNDTHGHPRGDQALIAVAEVLVRTSPAHAAICRAGGEEFLIAYPTNDPGPPTIAPHLCTLIADLPHTITVSIGTCTIALDHHNPDITFDTAIAAADTAMYTAKRNGGNHTTHTTASSPQHQPTRERFEDEI